MDFKFKPEEQDVINKIHDFCLKEVQPQAAEIDENARFSMETWNHISELGVAGSFFSKEYGGAELSYVTYIGICEELARYCAATSCTYSAHGSLCCWPINEFGTDTQKKKYLPRLLSGEHLGAFCLTEPGAGTDAAMQATVIEDKGDHWLMNGSKIFITNAGYASVFIVFGMTDKSQGTKGISAFIVEPSFPGFKLGRRIKKMGIRGSSTHEIFFENMKIPKENLLGEVGKGFRIAMATLDGGRIGIAAQALGIAEGAIEECSKYVTTRIQFGKRISQFQNTQFELADMRVKVEAARLLTYQAAQAKQDHEPHSHLAAMAKLYTSENGQRCDTPLPAISRRYGLYRRLSV